MTYKQLYYQIGERRYLNEMTIRAKCVFSVVDNLKRITRNE